MEDERQDWVMYETNDEGDGPKLWQIRESFPENVDSAQYPVAVVIEWSYSDEGLPDAEALSAIHTFEDSLGGLNTEAGNSFLVHIIRGSGVSELCYYVQDYNQFMAEFNDALSDQPRYPVEIEFMNDPGWEYRRSILENFSQ
ncbi:DUF695 domain-containing protein [Flavobacterium sp. MXW15]|uniref:DUF695 domain-containing protein n=1 Tax=Xanthomonas chitinilytica TaxID=2989819 RepID=A0ABT3JWG4_9XANT|nr:DUF695 domain-containing protein [Xanthomonas sp. H13-6]MCW4455685.1 DUF695 domain-containing protein [Flavobacterium sp. MXW15]MCW4472829.1 DUF695 domain-containing protein [Xanthomonas sp. H13-6]